MWHVVSQKNGVSALGLQRVLGLGSYQTAWAWMHKLRRAMVRPGRERLTGVVEVDETYWGAEEEGVRGRQIERKGLIAVAAEERGSGLGRIRRMQRLRNASAASLMPFVEESIEPGSVVRTDVAGLRATREEGLSATSSSSRVAASIGASAGAQSDLAAQALVGVRIEPRAFGTIWTNSSSGSTGAAVGGKLFYRLVQQAVAVEPTPYRSISPLGRRAVLNPKHKMLGSPESGRFLK